MLVIKEKTLLKFTELLAKEFDFFDVSQSELPPKQYFLPEHETIFTVKNGKRVSTPPTPKEFVLFGLSFEDLEAITYLDEIMKKPVPDNYYFSKRNKAVLIGIINEKILIPPGGDVLLQKIKNRGYAVITATGKGERLIKKLTKLGFEFSKIKNNDPQMPESKTMPRLRSLLLSQELLHDAVKWSYDGYPEIWDELAGICLGCGICTYVCPLCHCFSVEDKIELSGSSCSRCRYWTACTLPEFARVAGGPARTTGVIVQSGGPARPTGVIVQSGGHNFHKDIRERYYNWFYHKFVRAYVEFGKPQCTACGKCKKYCPAKIDIEKILLRIIKEYRKKD